MVTHWALPQRDLFDIPPPPTLFPEAERQKVLDLLQALLAEAMTPPPEESAENGLEASNDEDIA